MKKKIGKFYDILTTEGSNEATIFLYGYIGEEWEYADGDWQKSGVTDVDFVKELDRLAAQYSIINIRINSFGGEIFHGMAIVNAMQRCTAEIHTYIDGLAASMAGAIWLAGKHRHMAKNALLMLHAGSNMCWGNAQDMREMAGILDQFTQTIVLGIAESTGTPAEEINSKYFADYKDHWLTHTEVSAESNWITDPEDYAAALDAAPADLKAMNYHQLVAFFKEKESPKGQTIMQQLRAVFAELKASLIPPAPAPAIPSPTNTTDMNFDEFKTSLADGTLQLADVTAHLATVTDAAPAGGGDDDAESPLQRELRETRAEMAALKAEFTAFAKAPGAGKSTPGAPDQGLPTDDASPKDNTLNDFNTTMATAAKAGENPIKRRL
jgi:ATP-dependent protease ClpP protease subunit